MLELFIFTAIISLLSITGVIYFNNFFNNFFNKNGHYLISFSAGIFLATSGFIILEVFAIFNNVWQTFIWIIIGFILSKTFAYLLPEIHHHHDACCLGHKKTSNKIIIGDSLHNIADGLVLASSYLISPQLLFPLFVSIAIHEFLQEISEFFVLKESGYSTKSALFINFLTSLTIFIGVIFGLLLGGIQNIQVIILALSSGFFLNIVFDDLFPHQHKNNKNVFIKHLAILFIGLILMFTIIVLLIEDHVH